MRPAFLPSPVIPGPRKRSPEPINASGSEQAAAAPPFAEAPVAMGSGPAPPARPGMTGKVHSRRRRGRRMRPAFLPSPVIPGPRKRSPEPINASGSEQAAAAPPFAEAPAVMGSGPAPPARPGMTGKVHSRRRRGRRMRPAFLPSPVIPGPRKRSPEPINASGSEQAAAAPPFAEALAVMGSGPAPPARPGMTGKVHSRRRRGRRMRPAFLPSPVIPGPRKRSPEPINASGSEQAAAAPPSCKR